MNFGSHDKLQEPNTPEIINDGTHKCRPFDKKIKSQIFASDSVKIMKSQEFVQENIEEVAQNVEFTCGELDQQ